MRSRDKRKLESIRKAVVVLTGRGGLVGLNMGEIAREAAIATGTLYIYFKSKEDLLRSVYWDIKRDTAASYFDQLDPEAPLKARLHVIWMNALAHRRERYDEAVFTEQYYQSGFISEEGRQETHRLFSPFFAVLEEGRRQQILKNVDSLLIAAFFIGAVVELAALERSGALKLTQETCEAAWQVAWDGIRG